MLILVPLVIGIVAGMLLGGRLDNWATPDLRWPWLLAAAILVRVVVQVTPLNRVEGIQYVAVLSLVVVIAWGIWHVTRLPGVWLVSAGAALNLGVMVANGARMPVSTSTGVLVQRGHIGQYVLMDSGTRLSWLGDWINLPWWLGGIYSPGDVVVGVGIGVIAFLVTRRPAPRIKLDETSSRIGSYPP